MNDYLAHLKRPLSRKSVITTAVAVIVGLVVVIGGTGLFRHLTSNRIVAYFKQTTGLYPGDEVTVMGVPIGTVDSIEPAGDRMKVTFHYPNKVKVPADATAVIVNPSLVASRSIRLDPPYDGGTVLMSGTVIPLEHTQVPAEWDDLRNSLTKTVTDLGPTPAQPKGAIGDAIESLADGLAGKGEAINSSMKSLSTAMIALNESRGETFAILRGLATFLNALQINEQQLVSLNSNLAQITTSLTPNDHAVADAVDDLSRTLPVLNDFLAENRDVIKNDFNKLATATTPLVQPDTANALETFLHVYPTFAVNNSLAYHPAHGGLTIIPAVVNFANPLEFICSSIQAASRLGYQDSAEMCAQYLAPILDAIKFNYLPFGITPFTTGETLPKEIAYSEPRLQPPPGYKDTTVPGVFSRDTPFSHGNHEPGWLVAPGMQGLQVQPFTENMLTPDSLAELMGGPNVAYPTGGQNMTGPPNAYDEVNPLPPPWYPQPGPPVAPAPGVVPGPVAPVPAPLGAAEAGAGG